MVHILLARSPDFRHGGVLIYTGDSSHQHRLGWHGLYGLGHTTFASEGVT